MGAYNNREQELHVYKHTYFEISTVNVNAQKC